MDYYFDVVKLGINSFLIYELALYLKISQKQAVEFLKSINFFEVQENLRLIEMKKKMKYKTSISFFFYVS